MYVYCTYFMLHKYTTVCPIQILIFCYTRKSHEFLWLLFKQQLLFHSNVIIINYFCSTLLVVLK